MDGGPNKASKSPITLDYTNGDKYSQQIHFHFIDEPSWVNIKRVAHNEPCILDIGNVLVQKISILLSKSLRDTDGYFKLGLSWRLSSSGTEVEVKVLSGTSLVGV